MSDLTGASISVFIGLTVVLIGGAGILNGQAMAQTWRPPWQVVFGCFGLTLVDRFLVFALFEGPLLSLTGFLVDGAVITAMALVAYRISLVSTLVRQYPWIYRRSSPFTYQRLRSEDTEGHRA